MKPTGKSLTVLVSLPHANEYLWLLLLFKGTEKHNEPMSRHQAAAVPLSLCVMAFVSHINDVTRL